MSPAGSQRATLELGHEEQELRDRDQAEDQRNRQGPCIAVHDLLERREAAFVHESSRWSEHCKVRGQHTRLPLSAGPMKSASRKRQRHR